MSREDEMILIAEGLIRGWIGARHEADSFWLMVQADPEWRDKFLIHFNDPFRREATEARFDGVLLALDEIAGGAEPSLVLQQLAQALKQNRTN